MRCLPCQWAAKLWTWLSSPDFDDDVEHVRQVTAKLCGFLPTVATVAAILSVNNPAVIGVSAIAVAICNAVSGKKTTASLMDAKPTVNGVVIDGEWVR